MCVCVRIYFYVCVFQVCIFVYGGMFVSVFLFICVVVYMGPCIYVCGCVHTCAYLCEELNFNLRVCFHHVPLGCLAATNRPWPSTQQSCSPNTSSLIFRLRFVTIICFVNLYIKKNNLTLLVTENECIIDYKNLQFTALFIFL